ncbi:MAG: hypothetical protein WBG96_12730 [Thermoanaerobaculia bacterium]
MNHKQAMLSPLLVILALASVAVSRPVVAQELSAAEEAARKAADPLGDIRAIMTDNTIAFDAGEDEDDTTFTFQIQPVYAIPGEKMNMILRGVIPIIGVEPGVVIPPIGGEPRPEDGSTWGLSDTIVQTFFSPKSDGSVKWGIGPQVSLKTQTSERVAGPGWGGGVAGVIFGGSGQWSIGSIVMQHWGDGGDFSIMTFQPIIMYMLKSMPGAYIGYNNAMTYNWKVEDSGQAFTMPLGLTFGKTIVLGSGDFIDLSVGGYPLVARPDGAARWQLKLGFSYFFN